MSNLAVSNFPLTGPAVATDLLGGSRSPHGLGDDLRLLISELQTFFENNPTVFALTDGANIATNAAAGRIFTVTLAGNRQLDNPTGAIDGMIRLWIFTQDGTGSRTITLDTQFKVGTDIAAIVLSTAANKRDYMTAIYRASLTMWDVIGFVRGYPNP